MHFVWLVGGAVATMAITHPIFAMAAPLMYPEVPTRMRLSTNEHVAISTVVDQAQVVGADTNSINDTTAGISGATVGNASIAATNCTVVKESEISDVSQHDGAIEGRRTPKWIEPGEVHAHEATNDMAAIEGRRMLVESEFSFDFSRVEVHRLEPQVEMPRPVLHSVAMSSQGRRGKGEDNIQERSRTTWNLPGFAHPAHSETRRIKPPMEMGHGPVVHPHHENPPQ
jgi:hypothetical protein